MATFNKKPLAAAFSAALLATAMSPAVADSNPFSATSLSSGYDLANAMGSADKAAESEAKCGADKAGKEGKCGEAKCGADKAAKEGKCGEAKCGADKAKEGKCGHDKAKEGKCGEAKCGADKAKEGKCGADKAKEGKCGEAKCGADK